MQTRLAYGVSFLAVVFLVVFPLLTHMSARPHEQQTSAPAAQPLTPSERRGKQIYLRTTSPSAREITAKIGEVDVPGSTLTCAGCHGTRGEGKTEGGVTAGSLTWANLVTPNGHTHPTGRRHEPFNESSFIRAVVNGVDPAGNALLAAMPRYDLSREDSVDLIAYLKRIAAEVEPGLTQTTITIGVMLPSKGALMDLGAAMKDVLTAYFDSLNSGGGIVNRKIELKIVDTGMGGADTAAAVQTFSNQEQVFAFVSGITAGADLQMAAFARNEETPVISPSTLLTPVETSLNRYVFYLLPGVAEQSSALVNFAAARSELRNARTAIVFNESPINVAAATAAEAQAKRIGRSVHVKQTYTSNNFDARRIVNELKNSGTEAILFFGSGNEQLAILREAEASEWTPDFLTLGTSSAKELLTTSRSAFKNKIFVAFPTVPADVTSQGMSEFRSLQEKYKFPSRHTAAQIAACAAAKIFVEALRRAGKDLSREKLITALEGLSEFETGLSPRITFGPNRRVGAAGAYVVSIEADGNAVSTGWIKSY